MIVQAGRLLPQPVGHLLRGERALGEELEHPDPERIGDGPDLPKIGEARRLVPALGVGHARSPSRAASTAPRREWTRDE
jgi:hypothetical protein